MHNICFAMQEVKLGRPVQELEAWEMMKVVKPGPTEPLDAPPKYFGKAKEKKELYCEAFTKLHPDVDDPMSQETDEVAMMVAGHGTPHDRPLFLSGSFKPQRNYTQIKATLPSDSYSISSRPAHPQPDVSHPHFHPLF